MNICEMTAQLLKAHGITTVVTSPGSRNAPIITAMTRCEGLKSLSVIDERAAAFTALGIALVTGRCVALVCTSGSAVLNYAPALAEAYYRRIPLIVISADRPRQWIDQNDSQTIRQNGALRSVVVKSFDIDDERQEEGYWYANRLVNEAILTVLCKNRPVHLNIHIDFAKRESDGFFPRIIEQIKSPDLLPTNEVREIAKPLLSPTKIMIIAGFMSPNAKMSRAFARLVNRPNVVVLAEPLSNLHGKGILTCIDTLMKNGIPADFYPDIVISTGGAIVSASLKRFLRRMPDNIPVWHVGQEDNLIDCYKHLSKVIDINPIQFFGQLASALSKPGQTQSDYAKKWHNRVKTDLLPTDVSWSALNVFNKIVKLIPRRWNVQVSNGTSIRYLQLCDCSNLHRVDCNRGVSGIDGSTMTALGASWAYKEDCTLLITGDMSLSYDLGWLTSPLLTPRFKIIVLNNKGGNIFRMVKSTKSTPEREEYFSVANLPSLLPLATAAGWSVYDVHDEKTLTDSFSRFVAETSAPAILMVNTPIDTDNEILTQYL